RVSGTALTEVPFSSAGRLDERAREGAGRGAWVGRCDPKDRGRIAYYARNGCGSANPSGRACRTAAQIEQSERLLDSLWGGRLDHVRLGGLHRREREMAFSRRTWPLPRVEARNRERAIVRARSTVRQLPHNYSHQCSSLSAPSASARTASRHSLMDPATRPAPRCCPAAPGCLSPVTD